MFKFHMILVVLFQFLENSELLYYLGQSLVGLTCVEVKLLKFILPFLLVA